MDNGNLALMIGNLNCKFLVQFNNPKANYTELVT